MRLEAAVRFEQNATIHLARFNFQSRFSRSYNLLFMSILLITILPLIVYLFLNRQIVARVATGPSSA